MLINKINDNLKFYGNTGIVLGSGLDHIVKLLKNKYTLPYHIIDSFPRSTVDGHKGEFISGYVGNIQVLLARGRLHYYEGIELDEVIMPLKIFHKLGIKNIIITNSSGSLRLKNSIGSLMLIDGHYDCTFLSDEAVPKLIAGESYYNKKMMDLALSSAKKTGIDLLIGKYCWMLGPAYETPAEIKFLKSIGGDAVGMSTLPEIEYAKKVGMKIIVLSALTNFAAGLKNEVLKHEDVLSNAKKIESNFSKLVEKIIDQIGS
jgi:purine-nucleoside phosphorylase